MKIRKKTSSWDQNIFVTRLIFCEGVAEQEFLTSDVEVLNGEEHATKGDSNAKWKRKSFSSNDRSHETLSVALIKSLSKLLKKFQSVARFDFASEISG